MIIQEINKLAIEEEKKTLRRPEGTQEYTDGELYMQKRIIDGVAFLFDKQQKHFSLVKKRVFQRLSGVISLTGGGTYKRPFKVKTRFGSGEFYRISELFKPKKVPKEFQKQYCHDNALFFALKVEANCKLISGLAYLDHQFLHSVIQIKDKILDFNYDVVMDADLYFKLTKFEVLSEIDGKRVKELFPIYEQNMELFKKISTITMVFAYEDVVDYLTNKERQEVENVEL